MYQEHLISVVVSEVHLRQSKGCGQAEMDKYYSDCLCPSLLSVLCALVKLTPAAAAAVVERSR